MQPAEKGKFKFRRTNSKLLAEVRFRLIAAAGWPCKYAKRLRLQFKLQQLFIKSTFPPNTWMQDARTGWIQYPEHQKLRYRAKTKEGIKRPVSNLNPCSLDLYEQKKFFGNFCNQNKQHRFHFFHCSFHQHPGSVWNSCQIQHWLRNSISYIDYR